MRSNGERQWPQQWPPGVFDGVAGGGKPRRMPCGIEGRLLSEHESRKAVALGVVACPFTGYVRQFAKNRKRLQREWVLKANGTRSQIPIAKSLSCFWNSSGAQENCCVLVTGTALAASPSKTRANGLVGAVSTGTIWSTVCTTAANTEPRAVHKSGLCFWEDAPAYASSLWALLLSDLEPLGLVEHCVAGLTASCLFVDDPAQVSFSQLGRVQTFTEIRCHTAHIHPVKTQLRQDDASELFT